MNRYFVFIFEPQDLNTAGLVTSIVDELLATPHWELGYQHPGIFVLHQPSSPRTFTIHPLASGLGVVIGSLFHRATGGRVPQPVDVIDETESQLIVNSSGRHLVRNYWGTYVVVAREPQSEAYCILRDPTATLACYHASVSGIHIFFSDMEDFFHYVPMAPSVDWQYVAARLLAGFKLSRGCALNDIEDVPGGEWVTITAQSQVRTTIWCPAQFCEGDEMENEQEASRQLRAAVMTTTEALAAGHQNILLLLSGGLDSSIVASCLATNQLRRHITCLNFYLNSGSYEHASAFDSRIPCAGPPANAMRGRNIGSADERFFARRVATNSMLPLIERERVALSVDFRRLYEAPLSPRPSAYGFIFDMDDLECDYATDTRSTACFTGHGGDSVFYVTERPFGAMDYSYLHGLGPRLAHEIYAGAKLSGNSVAHVVRTTVTHGLLRLPLTLPFDAMERPHLLTDEVASAVPRDYFTHPWLNSSRRLCPGKLNHVRGITYSVPAYQNAYRRERIAPSVHPLASQPVVETCLSIPTYMLLSGGISRGLARRAFRDLLPAEVYGRLTKGSGTDFNRRMIARSMGAIREHLLTGPLVREKLLDPRKLEAYLTDAQPFLTVQPEQIMNYLACDAWITQLNSTKERHTRSRILPTFVDASSRRIPSSWSGPYSRDR